MSRSLSASGIWVLFGVPRESGKSDFPGAPLVAPAGAAPRFNIASAEPGESRPWSSGLADEATDATLQNRPLALGALGNHDQARFGHEKALAVALEVVSDLFTLWHI